MPDSEFSGDGGNPPTLDTELERRGTRGNLEAVDAGEHIEDLLRDAVGEVLLVVPRRQIRKWKDGDRSGGRRAFWSRDRA